MQTSIVQQWRACQSTMKWLATMLLLPCCWAAPAWKDLRRLVFRWRHPLAADVSLIQTLAPGAELAVPVANAREGELCFQPAGVSLVTVRCHVSRSTASMQEKDDNAHAVACQSPSQARQSDTGQPASRNVIE